MLLPKLKLLPYFIVSCLLISEHAGLAHAESKPSQLVLRSDGKAEGVEGRYALIVAVDDYPYELNALTPPVKDLLYAEVGARDLKQVLQAQGGFPEENITELYGTAATNKNVYDFLYALDDPDEFPQIELLLLYFSGHGMLLNTDNPLQDTRGDLCFGFLPYDGSVEAKRAKRSNIDILEVTQLLEQTARERGFQRTVVFIDACQTYQENWYEASGEKGIGGVFSVNFSQINQHATGLAVLTSSQRGQASWEDPDLQMGVFTYYLLQALRGEAGAGGSDGIVTLPEVEDFVTKNVNYWSKTKRNREQKPGRFGGALGAIPLTVQHVSAAVSDRQQAEQLRTAGIKLEEAGRLNEALTIYQQAEAADPSWAWPPFASGNVHYLLGQYEQSISKLGDAIRLDPSWAMPYNNLGLTYYKLDKYSKAQEYLQEAIRLDPQWAYPRLKLGNLYGTLGQHDAAIKEYLTVLQLDPQWPLAHNNLGNKYLSQGKHDQAIQEFLQAIELDPEFPLPYNNLGRVYYDLHRYDEAIDVLVRAIDLHARKPQPHSNLSNVHDDAGRYELYREGRSADAQFAAPHYSLATVYYVLARYEDALTSYNRAISLDPKWALPYLGRGNVYYMLHEYEQAIISYSKGIELDPDGQMGKDYLKLAQDAKARTR